MEQLPKAIRKAAEDQGLTIEQLREKSGLSNGRFYELLKGLPPKKLDALEKLRVAGVVIPSSKAKKPRRSTGKAA